MKEAIKHSSRKTLLSSRRIVTRFIDRLSGFKAMIV